MAILQLNDEVLLRIRNTLNLRDGFGVSYDNDAGSTSTILACHYVLKHRMYSPECVMLHFSDSRSVESAITQSYSELYTALKNQIISQMLNEIIDTNRLHDQFRYIIHDMTIPHTVIKSKELQIISSVHIPEDKIFVHPNFFQKFLKMPKYSASSSPEIDRIKEIGNKDMEF